MNIVSNSNRREVLMIKLISLKQWTYARLDNSIKQHLTLKKISVSSNIFAGFDTEYVPIDFGKNDLLSAQLSLCGCVKIKVPISRKFIFEGVHTMTSEAYIKNAPKFDDLNTVISKINGHIKSIRYYKNKN